MVSEKHAMSKDDEPIDDELAGFVSVVFARNVAQAERFRELLEDHDIPALVGTSDDIDEDSEEWQAARRQGMTRGVPVMVPDALLDEAGEVIADLDDTTGLEEDEEDEEEEEEEEVEAGEDEDEDDDDDEAGIFRADDDDDSDEEDLFGGSDDDEEEKADDKEE
jgi:hypothetical protein